MFIWDFVAETVLGEIPRIAGAFGLDTSTRANINFTAPVVRFYSFAKIGKEMLKYE